MKCLCRPMKVDDMELVLSWRSRPDITQFMNTNPIITLEEQLQWYEKTTKDDTSMYWIIEVDNIPVGTTSITEIDFVNSRCTKGIYIGVKEKRSMPLFTSLYFSQYEFIFNILGLNKLETQVFAENNFLVELNTRLGNTREGVLRNHIKKDEKYYDIICFGMLQEEWFNIRKNITYSPVKIITDNFKAMENLEHQKGNSNYAK